MPTITRIDDLADLRAIAATLPDTPETVIALHTLRRGLCQAYITGTIRQRSALVLGYAQDPGEPSCYGEDPAAIWAILRGLPGWFAANMRESVAEAVGTRIERDWNEPPTYYGDLHFTLQRPAPELCDPAVRLLTPADLALLDAAPARVGGAGFGSRQRLLEDGIAAGAIVDDALVAIAHTFAITEGHADISVATLTSFQGRGYATAAASLVARALQSNGRTPVWSCGETNEASLRVARKLGFEPVLRRVYLIVDSRR